MYTIYNLLGYKYPSSEPCVISLVNQQVYIISWARMYISKYQHDSLLEPDSIQTLDKVNIGVYSHKNILKHHFNNIQIYYQRLLLTFVSFDQLQPLTQCTGPVAIDQYTCSFTITVTFNSTTCNNKHEARQLKIIHFFLK